MGVESDNGVVPTVGSKDQALFLKGLSVTISVDDSYSFSFTPRGAGRPLPPLPQKGRVDRLSVGTDDRTDPTPPLK